MYIFRLNKQRQRLIITFVFDIQISQMYIVYIVMSKCHMSEMDAGADGTYDRFSMTSSILFIWQF